jgi:hypothetical protein
LYDVVTGEDVWRQSYRPGTIPIRSINPSLTGVVEPTGDVFVMESRTKKRVMKAKLADPVHAREAKAIRLVGDKEQFYLAIENPLDEYTLSPPRPLFLARAGLRSIPVNGMVYSFSRKTGKYVWYVPIKNEQMVLSQFEDLPMVLFAAQYQEWFGAGVARTVRQVATGTAIAKHNGMMWWGGGDERLSYNVPFYVLEIDHRTGKVEFTCYNKKVILTSRPK